MRFYNNHSWKFVIKYRPVSPLDFDVTFREFADPQTFSFALRFWRFYRKKTKSKRQRNARGGCILLLPLGLCRGFFSRKLKCAGDVLPAILGGEQR